MWDDDVRDPQALSQVDIPVGSLEVGPLTDRWYDMTPVRRVPKGGCLHLILHLAPLGASAFFAGQAAAPLAFPAQQAGYASQPHGFPALGPHWFPPAAPGPHAFPPGVLVPMASPPAPGVPQSYQAAWGSPLRQTYPTPAYPPP